jgi:hypothetical protein
VDKVYAGIDVSKATLDVAISNKAEIQNWGHLDETKELANAEISFKTGLAGDFYKPLFIN